MQRRKNVLFAIVFIIMFVVSGFADEIHDAAKNGDLEKVKALLASHPEYLNIKDEKIRLINRAVLLGQTDVVQLIAELGCNLNVLNENGHTLLHRAAAYGRLGIVQILLEKGLDVNIKLEDGRTPLFFAAEYGHREVADLLIANGAMKIGGIEENYGPSPFLREGLSDKEAYIWYLNHSSWAVKTKDHLLIFDYTESGEKPAAHFISSGFIHPSELDGLNVSVFVSHGHVDHYDPVIFDWQNSVKDVKYILGFRLRGVAGQAYYYISPREKKTIWLVLPVEGDMKHVC